MNFDGTYPDESRANAKLLEAEKQSSPPVRVIVSYPQSEEWNGKPTKSFTSCKWLMTFALIAIIAASCLCLYFFVIRTTPHEVHEIKTQKYALSDEDIKNYLLKQVKAYYDGVKKEQSYADQLKFFTNEIETLKSHNLTNFINELKIPISLLVPHNIDIHTSIIENLYNYTQHEKIWLEYVIEYESYLTSYDFQKKDEVDNFDDRWGEPERKELMRLQKKYTTPMEKKEIGNSLEFYKTVAFFSDVINLIPGDNSIQQVSIIASIIHMDSNLTRNIDLAIFAADWRFRSPVYIDLSGADAPPTNLDIKNGEDGASGYNGGYFIGTGEIDLNKLHIISNGGAAAAGHHGANGKDGLPNLDSLPESTAKLKGDCLCCLPHNASYLNNANETVRRYKLYNILSCGEEGIRGGRAGEPGLGGNIILILPHKYEKQKGSNGAKASQGLNGSNGKSALTSCYHYAYEIKPTPGTEDSVSAKWTPITQKICDNATVLPIRRNPLNTKQSRRQGNKDLTQLINAFKNFSKKARDNLEYENDNLLFLLLEKIESNSALINFTSSFLLFDEFIKMEKKYSKIEIFRSFYNKVHNHVLNSTLDVDTKYALEYLQVAIWTKMSFLRNSIGELYIVDIDKYLDQLLNTMERLDVNDLKLSSVDDGVNEELIGKFKKIQSSLEPTNKLGCDLTKSKDGDRRMKCLLSMLSNIVSTFAQISYKVLDGQETYESYQTITNKLNTYKENVKKYFPANESNSTGCSEITQECIELNRTKSFEKMEADLFRTFEKLQGDDFFLEFSDVVKIILRQIHENRALSTEMYFLIRDFRDATEDISALLQSSNRLLFDKLLQSKLKYFNKQQFRKKQILEQVDILKEQMIESLLRDQYMRAVDAYRQWAFPFMDLEVVPREASKSELKSGIHAIKEGLSNSKSTINDRDSQIIKAEFKGNHSFYTWNNQQDNYLISELLSGREVNLRANLFDSNHVVNKQAIKFQTIELRLTGIPKTILHEYDVYMTHSGYSNYIYNGTATTIVGREIKLLHSFDHNRRSGAPKKISLSLEKIKNGEIKLSPYTSWAVRLEPTSQNNGFSNLQQYVNVTDVHLVGSGSYVVMASNHVKYNNV